MQTALITLAIRRLRTSGLR